MVIDRHSETKKPTTRGNNFDSVVTLNTSFYVSKKTSDSIVQKWRDAFNEMLADGTIMQIRKKWNDKLEDDPFPEIEDKP